MLAGDASLQERAEQAATCVQLSELDDEYGERFPDEIITGDQLADLGAGRKFEPSEESIESLKAALAISSRGEELGCPGYGE